MVKVWFPPWVTLTLPSGDIEPFCPAEAVMVYSFMLKLAVWLVLPATLKGRRALAPVLVPVQFMKSLSAPGIASSTTSVS